MRIIIIIIGIDQADVEFSLRAFDHFIMLSSWALKVVLPFCFVSVSLVGRPGDLACVKYPGIVMLSALSEAFGFEVPMRFNL